MEQAPLGKQGLTASTQGFGCMGLTTAYGTKLPDDQIIALLQKTLDYGVTLWDTANLYVYQDESRDPPIVCQEEIIGRAIATLPRDKIQIATKTGVEIKFTPSITTTPNGTPQFIREQCENSLRRLGVSCLDLFYLHRIDPNVPIEVSMTELKKLVNEGKIRYVGLSEASASTIRRAHAVHPVTAVQLEYSLWCRGIEAEVIPTMAELGIGLVAYSPLGRGFFGGVTAKPLKEGDWRATQDRMQGKALENNTRMLDRLKVIADRKGCTTAQLALAWVAAQAYRLNGAGVVPIPGTTKEKNLKSNVEAAAIKLSKEEVAEIEQAVPWKEVAGERYDEGQTAKLWENDQNRPLTEEEAKEIGL